MADGFSGAPDFVFATPIAVSPGTLYYLQLVVSPGGDTSWGL